MVIVAQTASPGLAYKSTGVSLRGHNYSNPARYSDLHNGNMNVKQCNHTNIIVMLIVVGK